VFRTSSPSSRPAMRVRPVASAPNISETVGDRLVARHPGAARQRPRLSCRQRRGEWVGHGAMPRPGLDLAMPARLLGGDAAAAIEQRWLGLSTARVQLPPRAQSSCCFRQVRMGFDSVATRGKERQNLSPAANSRPVPCPPKPTAGQSAHARTPSADPASTISTAPHHLPDLRHRKRTCRFAPGGRRGCARP